MKTIYVIKAGRYMREHAIAAETIDDAMEIAKALGMEPEDDNSEWVSSMPLVEARHDA